MSCLLVSGLTKDCNYILGGITNLYLGNFSQIANISGATDLMDTITFTNPGSEYLYEMEFEKNTGNFTNEMVVNNAQKYINQGFSFSIAKKDVDSVTVANELALGKVVAIARDRNGKYFVLGRNNGLEATVTSLNSGSAEGDFSGLVVTMLGAQIEFAPEWDNTINGVASYIQ